MTQNQHLSSASPLEMWGGVECTINRVGNEYSNQFERSGHAQRISDLDLIAGLGIKTLRYPILWENLAPNGFHNIDWRWADERIERLSELGITPIVGLVHHGSGPRHTSLVESSFADGLAHFAGLVAQRYPHLSMWTPVNEPLTTARFSGLYGHWYPHGRDERTFVRALLTQCKAVGLSMKAIRQVNKGAQLVQTEDLGTVWSTPKLRYQAIFENDRRWLSLDLLCGRITREHPLWGTLLAWGAHEEELDWFQANACPPDIMGINHYATSDRFLDENFESYPEEACASNGQTYYADVEAVRARPEGAADVGTALTAAWQRYQLPLAVTEAHIACTREEQMRWLNDFWQSALRVREEGCDVRAITNWALLGAYDWNCLGTRCEGFYESGAFDLRAPQPRPTAIAQVVRDLATTGECTHPVLDISGWWRRPSRLVYSPDYISDADFLRERCAKARPIVMVGASSSLGRAFARVCEARALPFRLLGRREIDIANPQSVDAALKKWKPWAVVNAADYALVDEAEQERDRCFLTNTKGPATLAASCVRHGAKLLSFSSHQVFDGEKGAPYVESDRVSPLNVYGQSKVEAEDRVLDILPQALVVRTASLFNAEERSNFVAHTLDTLARGETLAVADDEIITPTYMPDLAHYSLDLLLDEESGTWHLANAGAWSRADIAQRIAELADLPQHLVERVPSHSLKRPARRPLFSALGSERGWLLPPWGNAVEHCVYQWQMANAARWEERVPVPAT